VRQVEVIDTTTNTVAATIPVGGISIPAGVAVAPDGSKVYVSSAFDGNNIQPASPTVWVIDTTTNTVTATIPVGRVSMDSLGGVAVAPDGSKVCVTNSDRNSVLVIDTTTDTVTATISVGTDPAGVAVTKDGSKVYVANSGTTTVSAIDTATNTVIATIPVGADPSWIAVTPDGSKAYVVNRGSDTVSGDQYGDRDNHHRVRYRRHLHPAASAPAAQAVARVPAGAQFERIRSHQALRRRASHTH
jgi:YVTN family beta-propeller protein